MISADRVRQAREIRGLSQEELAKGVQVDQSYVSWLEQGAREPSAEVLEGISLFTHFPVGFFRQGAGPEFPLGSLLYRKRGALASREKSQLRQVARLAFEIWERLAASFKPLEIRIPRLRTDPVTAATIARAEVGLSPDTPALNLTRKLEQNGAFALALPFPIHEHDAFSLWADSEPRKPLIVLTAAKPGDRQRFSVAHELGHLVIHPNSTAPIAGLEREANAFASEFLLPEDAIRRDVRGPVTLSSLADLKAKWGVSISALVMRIYSLGIITDGQRKYLYRQIATRGWRTHEPVPIPPEKPRLFRKMAETLFGLPPDITRLAALVEAPPKLVAEIMDCHASQRDVAGGVPHTDALTAPLRSERTQNKKGIVEFRPKQRN